MREAGGPGPTRPGGRRRATRTREAEDRLPYPAHMAAEAPPAVARPHREGLGTWGRLRRATPWWALPLTVVAALAAFTGYSIWTSFFGPGPNHVAEAGPYLSPFFSPLWWKTGPVTPALWVLWSPLGFRATCYYYRKAYYRSFWLSPPACAVADAGSTGSGLRQHYSGETRFPLLWNNIHRYTWYFALIFAGILTWDAIAAFRFPNGIGLGVGTILFVLNAIFIWAYTLGCHAGRHLCGGNLKRLSQAPIRRWWWKNVSSQLNAHHQLYAWLSLFSIIVTDLYTWLVASGTIHDPRIF